VHDLRARLAIADAAGRWPSHAPALAPLDWHLISEGSADGFLGGGCRKPVWRLWAGMRGRLSGGVALARMVAADLVGSVSVAGDGTPWRRLLG
jgi:hypothetical protein